MRRLTMIKMSMTALGVLRVLLKANASIRGFRFEIYNYPGKLPITERTMDSLISHNQPKHTFYMDKNEFLNKGAAKITRTGKTVGVHSLVPVGKNIYKHIPLLDFNCEVGKKNLEKITAFLKIIKQNGAILNSGNSYHFIGINLMAHNEWLEFMGRSLLCPLIDSRYIGHRLIDGFGSLRVTPKHKGGNSPLVVGSV